MGIWAKLRERRQKRRGREGGQLVRAVESRTNEPVLKELPGSIGWLLDAPLFIDEKLVEAFYDAVLRPDFEGAAVTLSDCISAATTIGTWSDRRRGHPMARKGGRDRESGGDGQT